MSQRSVGNPKVIFAEPSLFRRIGSPNWDARFGNKESLKCSYLGSTGQPLGNPGRATAVLPGDVCRLLGASQTRIHATPTGVSNQSSRCTCRATHSNLDSSAASRRVGTSCLNDHTPYCPRLKALLIEIRMRAERRNRHVAGRLGERHVFEKHRRHISRHFHWPSRLYKRYACHRGPVENQDGRRIYRGWLRECQNIAEVRQRQAAYLQIADRFFVAIRKDFVGLQERLDAKGARG